LRCNFYQVKTGFFCHPECLLNGQNLRLSALANQANMGSSDFVVDAVFRFFFNGSPSPAGSGFERKSCYVASFFL
jgi:hypothetical protein